MDRADDLALPQVTLSSIFARRQGPMPQLNERRFPMNKIKNYLLQCLVLTGEYLSNMQR